MVKLNLLFFVRILLRHIALLIGVPILLAVTVFILTKNQPKIYDSKARVYTGFASGSTIELDNTRLEISKTNIAYENLLNLIRSRTTLEEVSLRLFTQHMLLDKPDERIIGKEKFDKLQEIVPEKVKQLVVKGDFDATYTNFLALKNSDPYNFIYELLNLNHPDYSTHKILERITLRRVSSSDFVDIGFQSEDPGICQNTLLILTKTFIKLNQEMKVNQSDEVVNYFKRELQSSTITLKKSEDELLEFNKENKLMNYYEQTKQIAASKEIFETEYQTVTQRYYGSQAVLTTLEQKLSTYDRRRINSTNVLELRDKLSKLNFEIAMKTTGIQTDSVQRIQSEKDVNALRHKVSTIEDQLTLAVDTVFTIDHTTEGVGATNILAQWLENTIKFESAKAELQVLDEKRKEFDETYARYAPLGATMKRLERKINIAEQEYLSLLHSLGLAKLKQQNAELQTNIKITEIPFFPIEANPSKRLILVIVAGIIGFVLVAFTILALVLLDANINTAERAEEKIGLKVSSIFPVISSKLKNVDFEYLKNKAVVAISRNIILNQFRTKNTKKPIVNMLFSTQEDEGKTFICKHLISKLCELDYAILHITSDTEDLGITANTYQKLTYTVGDHLYKIAQIEEFDVDNTIASFNAFDFILLELPSIIKNPFPVKLASTVDHSFLVVRANRSWNEADNNALKLFNEATTGPEPTLILNGVKVLEMENVLGEIPKKRSRFRRWIKKIVQMRFFTKSSVS
ncbi:GumC family protein [Zhouia sp. PK063]|uniref:GumC family protein n=1 Tax=Zhouia sp. PK063 TaxID=3373602 RepID=UPI00378AA796